MITLIILSDTKAKNDASGLETIWSSACCGEHDGFTGGSSRCSHLDTHVDGRIRISRRQENITQRQCW